MNLQLVPVPEHPLLRRAAESVHLLCRGDHPDRWVSVVVAVTDLDGPPGNAHCPECVVRLIGRQKARALLAPRIREFNLE